MARKPLSNVDTAWLRMEDPTNLMMITGVLVFGAPMDYERLKATLEYGLLRFDRFRKRVVRSSRPGGKPFWEDDPDFDMDYHLQRACLPPPGDQAALQDVASLLASIQLDMSRPLWQFHLIENYGDGCALVCRLHHSIGDGLALVYVLLSLADTEPDTAWPVIQPEVMGQRRPPLKRKTLRPLHSACRATGHLTRTARRRCRELRANPSRAVDLVRIGAGGTAALGRLVFRWPDPKTVFKGELGVPKRAAWSAPIPLQDVRDVGKGLEGTVNDVLLTAMTGGLRRYLQGRGESVAGLNIRAIVPVNLRKPGSEAELGNKFGLVFLSLPIGIGNPVDRAQVLSRRMNDLKGSLEAPVAFGILNTMGLSPQAIQDILVDIFQTKGTAVMTNVIGPRQKLYLAGAPLEALMFWVPQSGHLGMGVSILSYADQVWMGVITDESLVPDPEAIIAGFHAEFEELLAAVQKPERAPTVQEMSSMLDDALSKLDAALSEKTTVPAAGPPEAPKETAQPEKAPAAQAPERCQALTRAGVPCKNRPLPGSRFCRVHQEE